MGLSFREKPCDIHRFDISINITLVHFRAMYTKMALGCGNKTTITTLYERGLRHNDTVVNEHEIKLIKDNTATVRNTGIPHNRRIYSKDN